MGHPIKQDLARFKKIVKGKVRENLRKFISGGTNVIPKGDGTVKVQNRRVPASQRKRESRCLPKTAPVLHADREVVEPLAVETKRKRS